MCTKCTEAPWYLQKILFTTDRASNGELEEALIATTLHLQFPFNSPAVQLAVHSIRTGVLCVRINKLGEIGLYRRLLAGWLRQRVPNLSPAWPFDGENWTLYALLRGNNRKLARRYSDGSMLIYHQQECCCGVLVDRIDLTAAPRVLHTSSTSWYHSSSCCQCCFEHLAMHSQPAYTTIFASACRLQVRALKYPIYLLVMTRRWTRRVRHIS